MRGLSEVVLRPAPAEQATDATLDIRREIGVRDALICAADLMPGASAISEKGYSTSALVLKLILRPTACANWRSIGHV